MRRSTKTHCRAIPAGAGGISAPGIRPRVSSAKGHFTGCRGCPATWLRSQPWPKAVSPGRSSAGRDLFYLSVMRCEITVEMMISVISKARSPLRLHNHLPTSIRQPLSRRRKYELKVHTPPALRALRSCRARSSERGGRRRRVPHLCPRPGTSAGRLQRTSLGNSLCCGTVPLLSPKEYWPVTHGAVVAPGSSESLGRHGGGPGSARGQKRERHRAGSRSS